MRARLSRMGFRCATAGRITPVVATGVTGEPTVGEGCKVRDQQKAWVGGGPGLDPVDCPAPGLAGLSTSPGGGPAELTRPGPCDVLSFCRDRLPVRCGIRRQEVVTI